MKRIFGIDASRSTRKTPTGVERYSTEIIRALLDELKAEKAWKARLYTPEWSAEFPWKLQKRIRLPRLWTLLRLSLEMLLHKPDTLFVPAHVLPFFAPRRSFVTVHDVAFEKYPLAYGAFQSFYLEWSMRRALKKCEAVIVPTEAVKKDLIEYYKANPERIHVIPHGLVPLPEVSEEVARETWAHYKLPKDESVFFFIGRLETKKNLMTLLEAWRLVQKKYSKGRLFLGGMYGHGFNELFQKMEDDDLKGTVLAPGYLSDQEVVAFFRYATALVLPSREEGFGLPILQAYASGCSVICSDIPALREVAGDAALFADPNKPKDFAKQMMKFIENPKLKNALHARARDELKRFSWTRAAKELLKKMKIR